MLVLSRKLGQRIELPQVGTTITVVEIRGDKVRIGVDAPKVIRINRSEIEDAMQGDAIAAGEPVHDITFMQLIAFVASVREMRDRQLVMDDHFADTEDSRHRTEKAVDDALAAFHHAPPYLTEQ